MERLTKIILLNLIAIFVLAEVALGKDITINNIINDSKNLNGNILKVQGEAIGQRMDREGYSWVNINDGSAAIGVWMPKKEAEKIGIYGDYKNKGDIVEFSGQINSNCKEHNGEIDIHTNNILIKEKGYRIERKVNNKKIKIALLLLISTLILGTVTYRKDRVK